MMRRAAVRSLAIWCLATAMCAHAYAAEQPASKRAVAADTGTTFTITFDCNKPAGYEWMLSRPADPAFLDVLGEKYIKGDPRKPGKGGKQEWSFKALKAGETTLEFKHTRPWDKEARNVPPVILSIVISDHK